MFKESKFKKVKVNLGSSSEQIREVSRPQCYILRPFGPREEYFEGILPRHVSKTNQTNFRLSIKSMWF